MNTLEFVKQTSVDPAACEKMAACKTSEEAYEIARAAGVADSLEDFVAAMEQIKSQVSEISEDDLEGLNAGLSTAGAATMAVGSVAGTAAAGAAMF